MGISRSKEEIVSRTASRSVVAIKKDHQGRLHGRCRRLKSGVGVLHLRIAVQHGLYSRNEISRLPLDASIP